MAKRHRLTRDEYAHWKRNTVFTVNEQGEFVRIATPSDLKSPSVSKQSAREHYKEMARRRYPASHITLLGPAAHLALAQIRRPSISPPGTTQLTVDGSPAPQFIRVTPEQCQCGTWAGREAGKHHSMCFHNKTSPIEEQATAYINSGGDFVAPTTPVRATTPEAPPPASEATPPEEATAPEVPSPPEPPTPGPLPSPEPEPSPDGANGAAHDTVPVTADEHVLTSLEGEVLRPAHPEEIELAAQHELSQIQLAPGGDWYMVMRRSDLVE